MKVNIGEYLNSEDKGERVIEIHIDDYDIWNMDHTLALIILPMLKKYKSTFHGIPSNFCYDQDETELPIEESKSMWNQILDKMIWSFEAIVKDDDLLQPKDKIVEYNERIQEGLNLFAVYFRSLWD